VGRASKLRGVVLFPTSRNSDTYLLNAVQMEEIRNQAIDRLVKNMGVIFSSKLK
jgi:hypothetical protein